MIIAPRLLFLSFLGFGLIIGLFVGSLSEAIAAPPHESGQHNSLFVLVDDLSAEHPTLQGIWLAARSEGSGQINWMPIYPAPLDESVSEYSQPHVAFYLPSSDFEDVNALPPMRHEAAWWDDVFWMDNATLGLAQALSGAEPIVLADTWLEPQRALFEQVQILNAICQSADVAGSGQTLDQLLALMPNHLRSSLSPFELITHWDAWSQDGFSLSCTHPWAN